MTMTTNSAKHLPTRSDLESYTHLQFTRRTIELLPSSVPDSVRKDLENSMTDPSKLDKEVVSLWVASDHAKALLDEYRFESERARIAEAKAKAERARKEMLEIANRINPDLVAAGFVRERVGTDDSSVRWNMKVTDTNEIRVELQREGWKANAKWRLEVLGLDYSRFYKSSYRGCSEAAVLRLLADIRQAKEGILNRSKREREAKDVQAKLMKEVSAILESTLPQRGFKKEQYECVYGTPKTYAIGRHGTAQVKAETCDEGGVISIMVFGLSENDEVVMLSRLVKTVSSNGIGLAKDFNLTHQEDIDARVA